MQQKTVLGMIIGLLALMGVIIFATSQPNDDIELPDTTEDGERVRSAEDITLSIGESGDAAGLEIRLNEFVQDNRCPEDVDCIEAGGVTINATLVSGDSEETRNMASDEAAYEFAGYAISITGIEPARMSDVEIEDEEYEITFFVEPLAGRGEIPANI